MIKYYNYVLQILILLLSLQSSECRHHGHGQGRAARAKKDRNYNGLGRIIGGTAADPNESPYQVSIQYDSDHICGGAILAPTWVVTAGHCIMGGITVLVGVYDLKVVNEEFRYEVEEMFQHCSYLDAEMNHDIGMIRTKKRISFNEKVAMIQLETEELEPYAELRLTGWGATKYERKPSGTNSQDIDIEYPTIKQAMTFKFWPRGRCLEKWEPKLGVDEDGLCAYNSIGHGACVGDSGSPLTHKGKIVGLASYVSACARGLPDVFVSTFIYHDFIRTVMNDCPRRQMDGDSKAHNDKITKPIKIPKLKLRCARSHSGRCRKARRTKN
ncbi:chymotrypsin-2-like [Scaptodrosophila lebanonensis]|uniref:trypsin n=1 Tax=Drosophila lebanonensis TaxID=7225 RepID=A0A6J2T5Y2_DROLE|nr:chymotrypsin-2-like [Scaptodrosophila lebanonensis]